ncbi:MAG: zinc-dependent alcohol dehydrogenase [Acidimicrobiales bacterium]
MDALVWHGGSKLAVERVPNPTTQADEVVADVVFAGICGSDLHAYRGHGGKRTPPLVLGHEAVVRVGDGAALYAVFPLRGCKRCASCKAGRENLCAARRLLGLDRPGTFAEQVAVARDDLIPVPEGVAADVASLAEPLATALNAFDGLELGPGHRVAVIGLGSIGLLALYATLSWGCHVVGVDPVASRRRQAEAVGASEALASANELEAGSFDVVVDAVGIEATWAAAIRAVRAGGIVDIVGLGEGTGAMAVGALVRAGITVRGSYAYTRKHFAGALRMLGAHPPTTTWLERLPLAAAPAAFERLATVSTDATKVLLEMGTR